MALMSIHRTTDSLYQPHSIQTTFIASLVIWRQTAAILASSARASPCRRARRGATQPASARMRTPAKSSADGLFQPEVEALSRHPRGPTSFTIGCVNFGFQQSMMEGKRQCTYNLGCEAVCTKIVYDGDCDILFGCEVGAYGKGLAAANIEEFVQRYAECVRQASAAPAGKGLYVPGNDVEGDQLRVFSERPVITGPRVCQLGEHEFLREEDFARRQLYDHVGVAEYRKQVLFLMAEPGCRPIPPQEKKIMAQNIAHFQRFCHPGSRCNRFSGGQMALRCESACVGCAQKD